MALVSAVVKQACDLVGRQGRIEGRAITFLTSQRSHLTQQILNQLQREKERNISNNLEFISSIPQQFQSIQSLVYLTDCHARWDRVRVHDDVRIDALLRERHVLLAIGDTARSLLSVARTEFVANLRNTHLPHAHGHALGTLAVRSQHHSVDNT